MVVYDFEYDGVLLSEMGYMLCKFDNKSSETIQNGSELKFNTVASLNGSKYDLVSYQYDNYLTGTLSICKNPCQYDEDDSIPYDDFRRLMRWLNRKEYHTLRFITEDHANVYYEASFNVSKVMVGNRIVGAELEFFTNKPFGNEDEVIAKYNITQSPQNIVHFVNTDEEGYIYPYMEVTISEAGTLTITTQGKENYTVVDNCVVGEKITFNYPVITSSDSEHNKTIQDDFNWNFPRLYNSFNNSKNIICFSLNSNILMKYSPIVKMGIVGD